MDFNSISLPADPVSVLISLMALGVSWFAIVRANKGASASSLIAIYGSFRDGWARFFAACNDNQRTHEFAELLNTMEMACALYDDKAFTGPSKEILQEYLDEIFKMIASNEFACAKLNELSSAPTTFKYIKKFRKRMQRQAKPLWKRYLPLWLTANTNARKTFNDVSKL